MFETESRPLLHLHTTTSNGTGARKLEHTCIFTECVDELFLFICRLVRVVHAAIGLGRDMRAVVNRDDDNVQVVHSWFWKTSGKWLCSKAS